MVALAASAHPHYARTGSTPLPESANSHKETLASKRSKADVEWMKHNWLEIAESGRGGNWR